MHLLNFKMKKTPIYLLTAILLFATYWFFLRSKPTKTPEAVSILLKKHSPAFNQSISNVINEYLAIKDAFVEGDTNIIKSKTSNFIKLLDNIDTVELKKDSASIFATVISAINDVRSNAESILAQTDITEMRKDFSSLTEMMFPSFFYAIKYEGPTLYLQNCPMAIDDSIPANWISNSKEILNPYLGKNHHEYKATMLHCGELKDSITAK